MKVYLFFSITVQTQESALGCLMKFAACEGQHPLEDLDWSEHYSFPRELIQVGLCEICVNNIRWIDNDSLISSVVRPQ